MPAIPDEFFIALTTVKGVSSSTAEFQHLLNHPSVLSARGIAIDEPSANVAARGRLRAGVLAPTRGLRGGYLPEKPAVFVDPA